MNSPADVTALPPAELMRSVIQRVATGPELSKDISEAEARGAMAAVLSGDADPVQAAIFLIALRMKRETDDENRGILQAVRDATTRITADVDEVVDLADPYDGFTRYLPIAPFLPIVLAELGVHTVSHGLDSVGPKFGVTHRHVMAACGVDVDITPEQAAARLSDAALGWSYVDQARYCAPLHDLVPLRQRMVKRQALTTVEVMAGPIVGRKATRLVTGYVHKPYPRIYAMLARHAGYDSALLVRGVEGGVIPSLRQAGQVFQYHEMGEELGHDLDPIALGIEQEQRACPLPGSVMTGSGDDEIVSALNTQAAARAAAEAGKAALAGEKGTAYDSLVYGAALVLWHVGKVGSLQEATAQVRATLDSGNALSRLK